MAKKKGCPMGTPFAVTDAGLIGLLPSGRNGSPHGEDTTSPRVSCNLRSAVWRCSLHLILFQRCSQPLAALEEMQNH